MVCAIYINEAHAIDVWPIGASSGACNMSHKKIEDRIGCAGKFIKEFDVNVEAVATYVDSMSNSYETEFAAWPFRYHVARGKKLIKIGVPDDSEFDIPELFEFLMGIKD